jgi:small membrane protein
MIAQFILSILLGGILLYAWTECRRSPAVSFLSVVVATAGLYFVWVPSHSTQLAELVGIGRGVDLILYVWVCISLILLLSLHLKLRMQMELVTMLARKLALADARRLLSEKAKPALAKGDLGFFPSPMLAPTLEPQTQDITLAKKRARRLRFPS